MDPASAKLEPFLLMAKSAKGAAAAKLVADATTAPGVYVFSELLEIPSILEARCTGTFHHQYYDLLELFSYGTYPEYRQKKDAFPALNEAQVVKLKHLSLVSSAMQSRILPYGQLLSELDLPTVHSLESLIIDAVYADLLRGKLDQNQQQFEVEYTVGRDVPNDALPTLLSSLQAWSSTTSSLLTSLDSKLQSLAARSVEAARHAEMHEKILEANLKEIADKREKSKRTDTRRELKDGSGQWNRKDRTVDDDMDVDDSLFGSAAKGKNRKSVIRLIFAFQRH
ncbi:hypothetical protein K488DRAFT_47169 [Vararia minispora EC-137]|uniref:Uncharacterized protein n=1 Tax=Vararia minispora EC-137 TaxID=1314806 RepID=A0ACB8QQR5_9AGAM|nr:hypothetical protein K488DRAFT_47169 [Vararia minispora EC-137]